MHRAQRTHYHEHETDHIDSLALIEVDESVIPSDSHLERINHADYLAQTKDGAG